MPEGIPKKPPAIDSRLFQRARVGSDSAIDEMLETCRTYLNLVVAERLEKPLRARVGPSDIVQETIIAARENFSRFDGNNSAELAAWLRGILINKLREARRHHGAKRRTPAREARLRGPRSSVSGLRNIIDPGTLPSKQLDAEDERMRMSRALSNLSPDHQMVIRLRNWEGLSFEEVGARMGRNGNAARALWLLALEKLSAALEPHP